jgi:hypothetical protein
MSRAASTNSRLAPARRRAKLLKVASAGAAVVGFGILSVIVRGGTHSSPTAVAPAATSAGTLALSSRISQEASQASSSFFSSVSVTPTQPSSPAPQATTSTS